MQNNPGRGQTHYRNPTSERPFWPLVFQFDVPLAKFSHFLLPCCQTFSSCCQTFSFVVRFVHVVVVVWCLRPRGFVRTLPQILHFLHRKVLPCIFLNLTFCSLSAFFGYLLFHPSTISHQPQPMTNGAMSRCARQPFFACALKDDPPPGPTVGASHSEGCEICQRMTQRMYCRAPS